jgi:Tol biopolymer transport system component
MKRVLCAAAVSLLAALLPSAAVADVNRFELISADESHDPSISYDGRWVAFRGGRDIREIHVRDRVLGVTTHASVPNAGVNEDIVSDGARMSGDGRFVVFRSNANLETGVGYVVGGVWVRDLAAGRNELVSVPVLGDHPNAWDAAISRDGRFVVFVSPEPFVANDVNGDQDVYLRDRVLGKTEVVSLDVTGHAAGGVGWSRGGLSISDDGRYVAFDSSSHELVDQPTAGGGVYVRDRLLGTTELVSVNWAGQAVDAYGGTISGSGRYVAFLSQFWNVVKGDTNRATDVFVRDRTAHTTTRVSVTSTGLQANGGSWSTRLSPDGRFVAFISNATNLVPVFDAGREGIFVHDRASGRTDFVTSRVPAGNKNAAEVDLTAHGGVIEVALVTQKALVAADRDRELDVYVAELSAPGATYSFTLKPLSIDFGDTPLGSARTRGFWLRNTGATALPLLRVLVRSGDADMFVASHACGASIAPEAGCAIAVTFTPTRVGASATKLVVVAGNRQVRERLMVGTGLQP